MTDFFDNREHEYIRWTEEHRDDGYIVNVGGGFAPKVHRASRRCVTGPARSNYTTHEYKKDCSTDLGALEAKYGAALTYCGLCFPGGRHPVVASVAPRTFPPAIPHEAAGRIIEKLIAVYRNQSVPEMIREFEQWGFSAAALRERWELLHEFIVLAAYDRQPYTYAGGYERVWADEPGSLRRALSERGLLDPHHALALDVSGVHEALADARSAGYSLQSYGGTRYARTITEIARKARHLHGLVLRTTTALVADGLFRSFEAVHGIGPTIASKLCKYLLRELCLGNVAPSMLARCAQPILGEYHNSKGFKKLVRDFGEGAMNDVLQGLASSDDPYAIDAIFFINRFQRGNFGDALGS